MYSADYYMNKLRASICVYISCNFYFQQLHYYYRYQGNILDLAVIVYNLQKIEEVSKTEFTNFHKLLRPLKYLKLYFKETIMTIQTD